MNVSEIMANVVQMVTPEASVQKAARLMRDYDIGRVLVCEQGRLRGILTDRDLAVRVVAEANRVADVTAGEIMSSKPTCCRIDDTVKQAALIMEHEQVRRLPVLDFDGRLAGIVSLGDVSTHASRDVSGKLIAAMSRREHSLAETA